jgi:hypothetical protein
MLNLPDHNTCYYCKLTHATVEAGGVWYCPNPLCTGPGAAWFRASLKSYKEIGQSGKHTVDAFEAIEQAFVHLRKDKNVDDAIRGHMKQSIVTWLDRSENSEKTTQETQKQ